MLLKGPCSNVTSIHRGSFGSWITGFFPQEILEVSKKEIQTWHMTLPLSLSLLSAVSVFPLSILTMEVEASPAETTQMTTPLCLTKHSTIDTQTHPELPSSTVLGRPQSPAGLPEGRSEIKRRPQASSTYFRAKIKVRTERDGAQHNVSKYFWLSLQGRILCYCTRS